MSELLPKAFRRWRDTFFCFAKRQVSKEKATPGRSESPAQNRASKAAGQLARRYRSSLRHSQP